MQSRINQQIEERNRFLAAVSHDLRTPLTRLKLKAEKIDQQELQADIRDDINEMASIIDTTLDYLRGDERPEAECMLDIGALVHSMAEDAEERGESITVSGNASPIKLKPISIRRCLNNLIENSLRYGGNAEIHIGETSSQVAITIRRLRAWHTRGSIGGCLRPVLPAGCFPQSKSRRSRSRPVHRKRHGRETGREYHAAKLLEPRIDCNPDLAQTPLTSGSPMKKISDAFGRLRLRVILAAIVPAILTTACATAPKVVKVDQARVNTFAQHGYDSGIDYATAATKLSMQVENDFIQITSVQPKREGKYPLVIYLPGLGESGDAAPEIRNAWAKSGYVVLSLQPLKDDEEIWSSDAARRADFAFIRQDRYSSGVIARRLDVITKLIEYVKHGVLSGDEDLKDIDLSQMAIVGFDVGASTSMIVGGEEIPKVSRTRPGYSAQSRDRLESARGVWRH